MTRTAARRPFHRSGLGVLTSVLAVGLIAAGCTSGVEDPVASSSASDAGGVSGASDGGGGTVVLEPSDGGTGQATVEVSSDPYPVTPAPEGFEPPAACTGEGAYLTEVGSPSTPDLPERGGESLSIEATSIDGDKAVLSATVDGGTRAIEPAAIGETVSIEDQWTISVTSVCGDTDQVEFDLID
ncbi:MULTISPECIES: hypothetical protein [Brachybacterium]|uniref:Uncharacterized protein n=1 Tax=Brachybacterium rhamnosum TaxID=173361 RepID=A0ABW4PU40_9MICO|nr:MULTISPECIES: hypothetical protein [Brachybacterium]MCW1805509.1 hypothetical protein [Brachybacterium squillarum]QCR52361.1 hypothetical protein C1N80_01375 [Brachybacterium sp. SGAir0954]